MRNPVVAKAYAEITAAVAVLTGVVNGVLTGEAGESGPGGLSPGVDPLQELSGDCLDILTGAAEADAQLAGLKALAAATFVATADAAAPPEAPAQAREMAVTAEVACALTIGGRAAGSFLALSHALTTALPLTLAALQSGSISWQHARVMADEAATLDPAGAAALEAHFLDPDAPGAASGCPAGEMPASRFRHRARTWRERHHTESLEKRHAKGLLDRRMEYCPDQDGMAWLTAYLPADQAAAIWNRTTAIARGLQGPDESRTLTQLRADAFATALLSHGNQLSGGNQLSNGDHEGSGPGQVPPPRAQVLVTVPVFSLLGVTEEPAMLDGYGPIPASMARDLVANGADSFYRVLIDPRDGAPLEIGRTSYRLTKAMRNWLRLRDGKCSFPGCNNQSLDNEADHLLAWAQGGTTGISNLGQACPAHHKLRHTTPWTPTPATQNEPPGWISPFGRRYRSEHQDWEPPHWPTQLNQPDPLKQPDLLKQPARPRGGPPDFVHLGVSLGEDGLERLLHARA
ncbi:HNH endonuclease signature motif containing protein [Pseudarthrobacter sulfonivorans]|uniref:HNH endonuclease signature motif containing protein n=1 Tax=Pseudarthrobacter sulfonivorans TaxID=121292 RepID=UPI00278A2779|nr:HNH endonuclease signature motif containing protein [Pseudarthrobacter sulfonivorans]MDP9996794.1 hypothetical protein [Pseudarthrobacter sulfonivorans]